MAWSRSFRCSIMKHKGLFFLPCHRGSHKRTLTALGPFEIAMGTRALATSTAGPSGLSLGYEAASKRAYHRLHDLVERTWPVRGLRLKGAPQSRSFGTGRERRAIPGGMMRPVPTLACRVKRETDRRVGGRAPHAATAGNVIARSGKAARQDCGHPGDIEGRDFARDERVRPANPQWAPLRNPSDHCSGRG